MSINTRVSALLYTKMLKNNQQMEKLVKDNAAEAWLNINRDRYWNMAYIFLCISNGRTVE